MRDVDRELKDAFSSMRVPAGFNEKTLQYIESRRRADESLDAVVPTCDAPQLDAVPSEARARHTIVPFFRRRKTRSRAAKILLAAACAAFALLGVGGYHVASTPTAFVDIDVNPSIGIELNRFDRVVSARAYNEDGAELLEGVDVSGLSFNEALEAIGDGMTEAGYLTNDAYMEISIAGENESQVSAIEEQSGSYVETLACEATCSNVDMQICHEARQANMGMGRYQNAKRLVDADASLTMEDCSHMTMREMRDRLDEVGGGESAGDCTDGCGQPHEERQQLRGRHGQR